MGVTYERATHSCNHSLTLNPLNPRRMLTSVLPRLFLSETLQMQELMNATAHGDRANDISTPILPTEINRLSDEISGNILTLWKTGALQLAFVDLWCFVPKQIYEEIKWESSCFPGKQCKLIFKLENIFRRFIISSINVCLFETGNNNPWIYKLVVSVPKY